MITESMLIPALEVGMHYFIGLIFDPSDSNLQNVSSFRNRFHPKSYNSSEVQLSLLPPFEYEGDYLSLSEALHFELESHLDGIHHLKNLSFNSIDIKSGKNSVIFLRPSFPIELQFCRDSILDLLLKTGASIPKFKQYIAAEKKYPPFASFLPLGKLSDGDNLEYIYQKAKLEFSLPLNLRVKEIALFQKLPSYWPKLKTLYSFSKGYDVEFKNDFCFDVTKGTLNK